MREKPVKPRGKGGDLFGRSQASIIQERIASPPSIACDTSAECSAGFGTAGAMAEEPELPSEQDLSEADVDSDEVGAESR